MVLSWTPDLSGHPLNTRGCDHGSRSAHPCCSLAVGNRCLFPLCMAMSSRLGAVGRRRTPPQGTDRGVGRCVGWLVPLHICYTKGGLSWTPAAPELGLVWYNSRFGRGQGKGIRGLFCLEKPLCGCDLGQVSCFAAVSARLGLFMHLIYMELFIFSVCPCAAALSLTYLNKTLFV